MTRPPCMAPTSAWTAAALPFRRTPLARVARAALFGAAGLAPWITIAYAQQDVRRHHDLPAQDLGDALNAFARAAGVTLSYAPAQVAGRRAGALRGDYTAAEGLERLLAPHGLEAVRAPDGSYALRPRPAALSAAPPAAAGEADDTRLPEVRVRARRDAAFGEPPPEAPGLRAEHQASATKMALPLRETPQAVSVITSDSIVQRQARDLTSALELTAGLVPSAGSTIGGPFAGRGLEAGELFMLRGQELESGRDMRVDGFAVSAAQFDLALFERIEVVKGPASVLYGQGSLGGFINLVRKKPQAERAASVALQAGSWDTYRAEVDVTGALDADERLRGRLIGVHDDGKSFIHGVWTRSSTLAPSLEWRPSPRTRVLMELLYQEDRFMPSHGIPLKVDGTRVSIPDIPRSRFVGIPTQDDSSSSNVAATVRVDHELSERWLATLVLDRHRQKFSRYFDNYGHGGLGPARKGLGPGETYLYADRMRTVDNAWAGELRVDGRFDAFGQEHRLLAGLERNKRSTDGLFGYQQLLGEDGRPIVGDLYNDVFPPGTPLARDVPTAPWKSHVRNTGVYAQAQLGLSERTKLLAGVRYDEAEQTADGGERKSHAATARLGVTHALSPALSAYATWGQSFNPVDARSRDGRPLEPERGTGYEVGLKADLFERRLSATAALYQIDLDNRPIPDPLDRNASISAGLMRTRGLELEVAGSPLPGLELAAGLSIGRSRHTDRRDDSYGLTPYGYIARNAGVSARYQWQQGPLRGFGIGATYTYIGKRSFAYDGVPEWVDGASGNQLYLPGFDRTDLNFYYDAIPGWQLSFQIRNLFDEVYIERMRDIESNSYFGAPRAFLLRASYRFR